MYPTSSLPDLSAIDSLVKAMELQVHQIKDRLREEKEAIPKAKVFSKLFCIFLKFIMSPCPLLDVSRGGSGVIFFFLK